ncbi:MAG TPA: lactate racemase domain-containing protein [Gemmataceae bacterium]|nr:lactate racemase domain-containing protein [Gemmataceae bacterium]
MTTTLDPLDRSACMHTVDGRPEPFLFHCGEQFLWEPLPPGTRVLYPPPPLPPLPDPDAAIEHALENPLGADPLSAQLRPGMRVTIAFDDISLPLPPMCTPDVRQRIIEKVLDKCAAAGVDDIHLICAIALHRRMTGPELREILGKRIFDRFYPKQLYNHDAEAPQGNVLLGKTDQGEEAWINKRVADSDLLIYVNINLVTMDGGHKSINTGLTTYRTIRQHHNVHTLMNCKSYMDPAASMLQRTCERLGRVVADHVKSFHVETTLNSNTFPPLFRNLQKPERTWNAWDKANFHASRLGLNVLPYEARRRIWMGQRAPYGLTGVHAGNVDLVHERTVANVLRQQAVPVNGPSDVVVMGLPYMCPYNVDSVMNPILSWVTTVGYGFNLYRGQPLVRRGGVLIFTHPLYNRWNREHHPSYVPFFERVLAETRDPATLERKYEAEFAHDERYIKMYREGHAYHGVHPFYMWYWGIYGAAWCGRVIAVPGDPFVAERLGFRTAPTVAAALEQARDVVGPSPSVTCYHWPPIFLCDVA